MSQATLIVLRSPALKDMPFCDATWYLVLPAQAELPSQE